MNEVNQLNVENGKNSLVVFSRVKFYVIIILCQKLMTFISVIVVFIP